MMKQGASIDNLQRAPTVDRGECIIEHDFLAALSLSLPVFFIIIASFLFHTVKVTHKKRGIILLNM